MLSVLGDDESAGSHHCGCILAYLGVSLTRLHWSALSNRRYLWVGIRRSTMKISTSTTEIEVVLVEIEGGVDAYTAHMLHEALGSILAQGHKRLVLDVSQMSFITSAGLRAIMVAQREASRRGGEVRACGLDAQTRSIFETIGLDECMKLSDTCQEAMQDW